MTSPVSIQLTCDAPLPIWLWDLITCDVALVTAADPWTCELCGGAGVVDVPDYNRGPEYTRTVRCDCQGGAG